MFLGTYIRILKKAGIQVRPSPSRWSCRCSRSACSRVSQSATAGRAQGPLAPRGISEEDARKTLQRIDRTISIPDKIFKKAERLARRLGISLETGVRERIPLAQASEFRATRPAFQPVFTSECRYVALEGGFANGSRLHPLWTQ